MSQPSKTFPSTLLDCTNKGTSDITLTTNYDVRTVRDGRDMTSDATLSTYFGI